MSDEPPQAAPQAPVSVSALSMIDTNGFPYVQVAIGPTDLVGAPNEVLLTIDQALAHASHVTEAACVAELESALYRWLVNDQAGSDVERTEEQVRENAVRIVAAFRAFRADPDPAIGGTDGPGLVHEPAAD